MVFHQPLSVKYKVVILQFEKRKTVSKPIHGERRNAFPLRSGARKACPLSPLLFNMALETLGRAMRQEKQIRRIQTGKEE